MDLSIEDDEIMAADQRRNGADVGQVASGEDQSVLFAQKIRQTPFELVVERSGAGQQTA